MKICADENVSWKLVAVLNDLGRDMPRLLHANDIGAKGVKDVIWVRAFANDGGEVIVSADSMMTQRQAELIAIGETGLKLIVLPSNYEKSRILHQTAYLLFWWPKILELAGQGRKGSYLKLPWNLNMPKIPVWQKIDLEAARQRLKKSTRPSRQKSI